MKDNSTTTTNGMATYKSSLNSCVDLFYAIGASRGKDIIPSFKKAFDEDPDMALRIAQWVRDVRGGSGERKLFKDILVYLSKNDEMSCRALMVKVPELGRWDDLLSLVGTPLEKDAFTLIHKCIEEGTNANLILNTIDDLSEEECSKFLEQICT